MPVLKCKMCGGNLQVEEGQTVCECEYCGSKQTIPNLDDDKKAKLYERANKLRFNCEFDKAFNVYQQITNEFSDEAEAYWGMLLCKYGIEYVEDPTTHKRIPTCHRSSFESIMDDEDFEMVMENADGAARGIYREEAKIIEDIRKRIIEVSSKEESYDIFICYKETDEYGDRTIDSVIAQDVYTALIEKGYKVFFSRITLEDKLGQEYEPYIFAALNSAKVMLAFGTSYDYYNAVWVKNEWSRFLQLIAKGEKKTLIPCYKGIDAYDIPKEFAHLQAQDMGKVGAIQDLLRGIEKIIPKGHKETAIEDVVKTSAINTGALLKRAYMFLKEKEFSKADEYFEKVLDQDPENGSAYYGKLLCEFHASSMKELIERKTIIDINNSRYYSRVRELGSAIDNRQIEELILQNDKLKAEAELKEKTEKENAERIKKEKADEYHKLVDDRRNSIAIIDEIVAVSYNVFAAVMPDRTVRIVSSDKKIESAVKEWKNIKSIAVNNYCVYGLKYDGTVCYAVGAEDDYKSINNWKNIIKIWAGSICVFAKKNDGKLLAAGFNHEKSCFYGKDLYHYHYFDATKWLEIKELDIGTSTVCGLDNNGHYLSLDPKEKIDLSGIKGFSRNGYFVALITSEEKIEILPETYKKELSQYNTDKWNDIKAVLTVKDGLIAVDKDGFVKAINTGADNELNKWDSVVRIGGQNFAGKFKYIALKADGSLLLSKDVVSGLSDDEFNIIKNEKYETIIFDDSFSTCVGILNDGTIRTINGCNRLKEIDGIKIFNSVVTIDDERKEAIENKIVKLEESKRALQNELSNLKGFFNGKKRKEIEEKITSINQELSELKKEY